ncbi:MAG: aminomethyl-transferring glycine dehydrogenase [Elusimicrobia bacterium]|nr:aminomethyl-transferring glycine dehydrogenase [Elusimicrobiota bacterium]
MTHSTMDRKEIRTPAAAGRHDGFAARHIGPRPEDLPGMLQTIGFRSLDELIDAAVPRAIRLSEPLPGAAGRSETEVLSELWSLASQNKLCRTFIGMGYHDCVTPAVIQRNMFENPGWYTPYTPYQAEISQGRLEALLNFQTMVIELTGLEVANASLLDEATAAAEAMHLCQAAAAESDASAFFVSKDCHPQTIEVVRARAKPLGIEVIVGDHAAFDFKTKVFGALVQYPKTDGSICDYRAFFEKVHAAGALAVAAADILALTILTPPGEFGADVAIGSTQRFGVPLGYGGPHAAYMSCKDAYKRVMPGRIVGVSKDALGRPALRLSLQTREQHIRREKATSNICTAQALLANAASMYAVYHGPEGLKAIARRVHALARRLGEMLKTEGCRVSAEPFFDTIRVDVGPHGAADAVARALERGINVRAYDDRTVCVALDETTRESDLTDLRDAFVRQPKSQSDAALGQAAATAFSELSAFERKSSFLTHPVFNKYHSETELMRYISRLESKDISLTDSMIPLGSCTMKLNAAAEMIPITWPEFSKLHPFVPIDQAKGYQELFKGLERRLREMTGFDAVSLMPNAGSQGEYAGLLAIHAYYEASGQKGRNVCLIPQSAHGTNPASAVMAGLKVVVVACDAQGNVDLADLKAKAAEHKTNLAALMITYPSTHGVFEETIREITDLIHAHGGQVYMDGANFNAQVGLCRPADFGADVCHLNLHKTFCIPHGGGGPGMGPIGVKAHLAPFLPSHPVVATGGKQALGPVSAAPWGSAGILPIPWVYIELMGAEGLTAATKAAILNANYVAKRLEPHFPVLYKGKRGLIAHECILDLRLFKLTADIQVEDVAKRLIDYGYHAPTVSFPVPGTLMIEPTESESREELDRFCDAMISIREEIREIEGGKADRKDNVLKNAPHTADHACATAWTHPYSREKAVYPASWSRERKYWPPVGRIDGAYGDRNFVCSCAGLETYT